MKKCKKHGWERLNQGGLLAGGGGCFKLNFIFKLTEILKLSLSKQSYSGTRLLL